ncbi:MAG: hypothetical protein C4534_03440 [Gaiellales bacterium]|nr:MAG: hypothetical protein C4534_03440 [Gaiellales bacterium]
MMWGWRDRARGERYRIGSRRPRRPRGDDVIGEGAPVVRDSQGPIQPFFDQHVGGPHRGLHLIELPVVCHRPIAT